MGEALVRDTTLDRTRAAIVDAAALVLAESGTGATLVSVADAAGISRATLYRHFSSRDELLGELVDAAYREVAGRIRNAEIDGLPFAEALARVARAGTSAGKYFVVLANEPMIARPRLVDPSYEAAMNELFERGKAEGVLDARHPTEWLRDAYRGIAVAALNYAARRGLGSEPTAALIVGQFLAGAQARA